MKLSKGLLIFTVFGLLLGVLLEELISNECARVIYYVFPIVFSHLFVLAYNQKDILRLFITSFSVAIVLTLPLLAFVIGEEPKHINHVICFVLIYPLFFYVANCFHYAYHQDSSLNFNYKTLFAGVWNTFLLLLWAAFFVGIVHITIHMCTYLYKEIGSSTLWDLYYKGYKFRIITNVTAFFIGIYIGQRNIKVIYSLRVIIIKAMYYLLPLYTAFSLFYLIILIYNFMVYHQSPLFGFDALVPLVLFGILLVNAHFQAGESYPENTMMYTIIVKVFRVTLFIKSIIMMLMVFYGFAFDINILVYVLTLVALTSLYLITDFIPREMEVYYIRIGNICVAIFFLVSLYILNLPYAPVAYMIN